MELLALLRPPLLLLSFLSVPFPCGKTTIGRMKRSLDQSTNHSEPFPDDFLPELDLLSPTESPSELLNLNQTQPEKDSSSVIRIVGGRACKDGECPWQVTGPR